VELLLAVLSGMGGIVAVIAVAVVAAQPGDPSVCRGQGPNCHPATGVSVGGTIATVLIGSVLPLAIAIGAWLDVRKGELSGLVMTGFASMIWPLVAALVFFGTGYLFVPSVGLGLFATAFGGVALWRERLREPLK